MNQRSRASLMSLIVAWALWDSRGRCWPSVIGYPSSSPGFGGVGGSGGPPGPKVPTNKCFLYIDEEVLALDRAIDKLSWQQRLVFKQHWRYSRSFREIETMLGASKSEVERIHKDTLILLHKRVFGTVDENAA